MDPSKVGDVESALQEPAHEVHDPLSDAESIQDALAMLGSEEGVIHVDEASGAGEGTDEEEAWEVNSALEDSVEEIDDGELMGGDICTLEEAVAYRRKLRELGPQEFINATIDAEEISAKKLLSAFGIRPPALLEDAPDEAYYSLLAMAISREMHKRMKLPEYNTIDDVVELLKKSKNIIVLTGAGISTSLGIPDFRSKDTGLYTKLAHLGLGDPQDVFDINIFKEDPTIFYSIAKDILPSTDRFSPTHAFIALLQQKGKLLTNYSQNIDNIEAKAGISTDKLIQCHGSFATASCIKCHAQVPGETIYPDLKAGVVPRCTRCADSLRVANEPSAMKRKRSHNGDNKKRPRFGTNDDDEDDDDEYELAAAGVMKPDITFFGEALPDTFHDRLTKHDHDLADLVIVIGTSLKVAPVSEVVPYLPSTVPQVYISRTPVSHVEFDVDMLGDCDVVVSELCRRAGWEFKHEMVPEDEKVNVELVEGFKSRYSFTVVKEEK